MPGVSRRFGKTAELICWTGPAGIPAQNQRIGGEILPNSYDLEQIGVPGTQDMSFGAEEVPIGKKTLIADIKGPSISVKRRFHRLHKRLYFFLSPAMKLKQ
jgi:hypothetical protein